MVVGAKRPSSAWGQPRQWEFLRGKAGARGVCWRKGSQVSQEMGCTGPQGTPDPQENVNLEADK